MRWLDSVLVGFGLLSILGGVEGYLAKGSVMSVVGGAGTGLIIIAGAALAKSHKTPGYALATFGTLAVGGMMLRSYMKSQALWPGLTFTVLSAIVLVCLVVGHFAARKSA